MFDFLRRRISFRDFLKSHPIVSHPYTPDEFRLDKKPLNLLFEYGELMNGFPAQRGFLPSALHPAFTVDNYSLWVPRDTGKPIALKLTHPFLSVPRAKIGGELFAVTKEEIFNLDRYRQNGVLFHRKEVKVLVPNGSKHLERRAFMYIGSKDWENQVKWDVDFYRGREGARFTLCNTVHDNEPRFRRYYHYLALDNLKPRDESCFLYFHKGLNDPPEPPKPVEQPKQSKQQQDSRAA